MTFEQLAALIQARFVEMCATGRLFTSSLDGNTLWYLYLNSFKPGNDPVFRDPESSTHNCNNDKHFIRRYGNIVALDENLNLMTMFDIDVTGSIYESSITNMREGLKESAIAGVYYTTLNDLKELPYEKIVTKQQSYQLGFVKTDKLYTEDEVKKFGVVNNQFPYTFWHFCATLPAQFVLNTNDSIASKYAEFNTTHTLFVKGLQIPLETLKVIEELLIQGSLLRADLYQAKVVEFIKHKQAYEAVPEATRLNWTWKVFQDAAYARFANELIGTTCIELAEGEDINVVAKKFNQRVDPANYMKATAPISQAQINNAAKRIEELGYTASFDRRFATLADVDRFINEILHVNNDTKTSTTGGLFAKVKASTNVGLSRHKRAEFDAVEEVSIETFMEQILPRSTSLSVLLENNFSHNLVALTTTNEAECKPLFKWNNPFSWTYNGNLAGKSNLTQAVSARGGSIDGAFRFSHSWNELEPNRSLMDLHVFLPSNNGPGHKVGDNYGNLERVGWNNRTHYGTRGSQDVDYVNQAPSGYIPVENITFPDFNKLPDGDYKCFIHNWHFRGCAGRGKAEIAFGGQLHQYIYPATTNKEWVAVATVTLRKGEWSIVHHLTPVDAQPTNLWGLDSQQFHKVNLLSLSPNYWGTNAVGNKHYLFFLEGCLPTEPLRSFHVENLNGELLQDRKVLEVLGLSNSLEPTPKQLAGVGFTNDSKESLIVKVEGSFKRVVKVKF